jgi:regulatory protein
VTSGDVGLGVEAWLAAQGVTRECDERPPASPASPGASDAPDPRRRGEPVDPVSVGPEADHEAVARKILLDQLTGQARSRSDLAGKLAAKGVPTEVSERLLDRFEEVGLVDDAAFARAWVQSRQPGKGLARRALGQELRRKGIDDALVRDALDEIDPDDEVEAARTLVRRKLRSVARVDQTTAVRRLSGMLARKGYPPGTAFRVVREELAAARSDESAGPDLEWGDSAFDDS